jgi:phospholipid transport system substrate-binding protein
MMRRFLLTTWFALLAAAAAAPFQSAAAAGPDDFIRNLGNQAMEVIRSGASPDQKSAYFDRALHQDFDLRSISRFVLGPYWRGASEPERQQFKDLLEAHLVRFYGQRLAEYHGESLRVTGSRTDPESAIVSSEIIRPQGPPIKVDWRLNTRNGIYKITDVNVDGVSMALTQRSEFAGLIQRNGGQLAGLLSNMGEDKGSVGSGMPRR